MRTLVLSAALSRALAGTNTPKCSVSGRHEGDGQVVALSDGSYDRCVSVISKYEGEAKPVLFNFHGAGGNAANCGNQPLADLAYPGGYALVCGEALQDVFGGGGQWNIPEVITDATGTPCQDSDSLDLVYIKAAVAWLAAQTVEGRKPVYDTSRIFFTGCSMGSAFTSYISTCWKAAHPDDISAFATHSTGLKVKGDGLGMPSDNYNPQYQWGECPDCQYFPFKPTGYSNASPLKACVFDNTGDGEFYETSVNMAELWPTLGAGNKVETHYAGGGHCEIHSFEDIVNCLDDDTGRLLRGPLETAI